MDYHSRPFTRVIRIIKNSLNSHSSEVITKTEETGGIPTSFIAEEIVGKTFINASEDEKNELQLKNSQVSPSPYKIGRLIKKTLEEIVKREPNQETFYDTCKLLTLSLMKNKDGYFNKDKKLKAIDEINLEIQNLQDAISKWRREKKYSNNKSKMANSQLVEISKNKGRNTVKIVRWIDPINKLMDLIEEATGNLPDYAEEKIWYEDLDQMVVVRIEEYFLFNGEDRQIAFCVLDTPITKNMWLIKLSTDYWNNNKEHWETKDEFLIDEYQCVEDIITAILDFTLNERDVEFCLLENDSSEDSHFETIKSLEDKISFLLK